jgi:hypothetical protein
MLAACTSDEQVLYSRLHRLGVDIEHLRLLDPTEDQLKELLENFLRLHDYRLVRLISSIVNNAAPAQSLLDERPCQEKQVALALSYPAHRVG